MPQKRAQLKGRGRHYRFLEIQMPQVRVSPVLCSFGGRWWWWGVGLGCVCVYFTRPGLNKMVGFLLRRLTYGPMDLKHPHPPTPPTPQPPNPHPPKHPTNQKPHLSPWSTPTKAAQNRYYPHPRHLDFRQSITPSYNLQLRSFCSTQLLRIVWNNIKTHLK